MINELKYLLPGIDFERDCVINDAGHGPVLAEWFRPEPMPSQEELDSVTQLAIEAENRKAIQPVTRRKFKLGLLAIGLLDDVEAAIAASGDRALQINYAEALDFDRNNQFVLQMSQALGKTDAEIDALFQLAASL